jgi:uncharacterized membrane protein YidH (DUF202 family)
MAEKSDLREVEITNGTDEGHLVSDLPLASIFSSALLLPLAIVLASLAVAQFHRSPIKQISSLQLTKQSSPNFSIDTGISDIAPENRFLSLSLRYQTDPTKSAALTSHVTFYTTEEDSFPDQKLELSIDRPPDQLLNVFKTNSINHSKISVTGEFQNLIPGSEVTLLWQVGDPIGFAFLGAIRLLAAVGSLTLLLDIHRKLDRDGLNSLEFSQALTNTLVIASLFYYNPIDLFFLTNPSPIETAVDKLFRDTFFSLFLTYSLLIFVPFLTDDLTDHRLYMAPYFIGLFSFSFALIQLVFSSPETDFVAFPDSAFGSQSGLFTLVLIVLYGITIATYIGLAFARVRNSTENRFWYYAIVNIVAFVSICVYEVIGVLGVAMYGNALYGVLPVVGVLLYTSLVLHGQRETGGRSVFNALEPPDNVDLQADNSLGIEANQGV